MFPSLVYPMTKAEKKEVCQKTQSDLSKAYWDISGAYANLNQLDSSPSSDLVDLSETYVNLEKGSTNPSKAYANNLKYQCLKNTPACNESLKYAVEYAVNLSTISAYKSEAYANLKKASANMSNSKTESGRHRARLKIDEYMSAIRISDIKRYRSRLVRAGRDIKKYCL